MKKKCWWKRLFLLTFFVMSLLMTTAALAGTAQAKIHKIRTAADWKKISQYNGGTFKLTKNILLLSESQYLNISKNKKYTIDLNGYRVRTAYNGVSLRTVSPLNISKGTVILKSSRKATGNLYSTETASVVVTGKAKFYLKSGAVVNQAAEFRSDITSAIFVTGNARCYLQGKSKVRSIGNGIYLQDSGKLYMTGNPSIRAGVNTYTGQFMHYGNGIAIGGKGCRLFLKGGSIGTKASADETVTSLLGTVYTYAQSGNYPILDVTGKVLKNMKAYKFVDAEKNVVTVFGASLDTLYPGFSETYGGEKKIRTSVPDKQGYYTVYIKKK